MKKVIRMLFVFFSSPSLLHPSCGLFVCQASSAHPPPKTPAPPPHPARETKKRTKRQKKSRQKLNLIPYQKKPSLEKSKIFNLENDKEPLDFPIPGELNKDRDVQPSLRARSSPSVLLWTGYENLTASERQRPRSETTANRIFTLHAPDLKSLISQDTAFPRNRFRNWIAAPSRT